MSFSVPHFSPARVVRCAPMKAAYHRCHARSCPAPRPFGLPCAQVGKVVSALTTGVLAEVRQERQRQHLKWGEQNLGPADWLMVIGEEVGEVSRAVIEHRLGNAPDLSAYRTELVQVAAATAQAVECLDRPHRGAGADATGAVLAEIHAERTRQDARWGEQNHPPEIWLMILGEEVGEANQAALEHHFSQFDKRAAERGPRDLGDYRTELVQVAAVAVSMIESLDRQSA